jgi:uncharacterized protein
VKNKYGPWALIAGGSEGIGLEFARRLAADGIKLLLLARGAPALEQAREALRQEFDVEVRTATVDLTSPDLASRIEQLTGDLEIGLLIYNAGATHGAALFHDTSIQDAHQLIALNCTGPLVLCHLLGGKMRQRGRGGIVMLSSLSALSGSAYVATYAASKAFDIGFAESLWAEMKPFGVDVLALVTGATDTPSMARAGADMSNYPPLSPGQVADEGLQALGIKPFHAVGEGGQLLAEMARGGDRAELINTLSAGAAGMFGQPWPPGSTDNG